MPPVFSSTPSGRGTSKEDLVSKDPSLHPLLGRVGGCLEQRGRGAEGWRQGMAPTEHRWSTTLMPGCLRDPHRVTQVARGQTWL